MPKYLRKKVKDERGIWVDVYGLTPEDLSAKVKAKEREVEAARELAANPRVFEYAQVWYARNSKDLSDSRKINLTSAINNYICPVIGNKHLAELTEADVIEVMDGIHGKSRSLQEKVLQTLRRILTAAKKEGYLDADLCEDIKAGGKKPIEKEALVSAQKEALLKAVQGHRVEGFVMIGIYTGMRREEILGLQWDCVKLNGEAPYIQVRRACRWAHNRPVVTTELKSVKARRDIPIPPQLVDWLEAEKERTTSDYVIHMADGQPLTQTAFKNDWAYITRRRTGKAVRKRLDAQKTLQPIVVEKAGGERVPHSNVDITLDFKVSPHILRHTYITDLILSGVNIKLVQYLAGHEKVDTTLNIYTHLMERRPEVNIGPIRAAFCQTEGHKNNLGCNLNGGNIEVKTS
jgi:integrase